MNYECQIFTKDVDVRPLRRVNGVSKEIGGYQYSIIGY